MIWSASLLATLALGDSVPGSIAERVRDAIAASWRVPGQTITLQWGPVLPSATISEDDSFRLAGSGVDGRFVAMFKSPQGREVAVTVRAGRQDTTWVAARALRAGTVVAVTDLARTASVLWGPPGEPEPSPLGAEVRRNLGAGDRLVPPAIVESTVIKAGDQVEFVWLGGPITVTRTGIALTRARRGESVYGRDPVRGERLRGVATGQGRARLVLEARRQ